MMNQRLALASVICLALLAGCAAKPPTLNVNPNGSSLPLALKFQRAYASVNSEGDDEIVLASEGLNNSPHQGKVLYPTNVGTLRQIVEIHVLWRPQPGTRFDQPSATNATINWHIRSNLPEQANDQVDYSGAGFVMLYPTKTGVHVVVRNATLTVHHQSGELIDTLGQPGLYGSFNAVRNDGIVKDVLASVSTPVAEAVSH